MKPIFVVLTAILRKINAHIFNFHTDSKHASTILSPLSLQKKLYILYMRHSEISINVLLMQY